MYCHISYFYICYKPLLIEFELLLYKVTCPLSKLSEERKESFILTCLFTILGTLHSSRFLALCISFSISHTAGLLIMNSLTFIYLKMSPLHLCFWRTFLLDIFFFGTLKVLFHYVLSSVVLMRNQLSFSKSSFPVHTVPLPPRSPHTSDILSLCFSSLTVMCPGVVLFMFILLGV